ncbi:Peptidase family M13 containing protein [Trichostrongylus colubriformis]|uniref:Peptidase family M13 containing protein n=1 Tax=Trichostrongylus colubriformis TaxID=6319 RepID=A0AAN8EXX4_TRICO
MSLNGTLTLGENIADNEGMKIAYRAYKKYATKSNSATKSEHVDGFTQDQLFFLGFSQMWCRKAADFTLHEELYDVHTPKDYRVNMVSKNFPPFATAFHCSPRSRMNSKHRCSIW